MKVLALVSGGRNLPPKDVLRQMEHDGLHPRVLLFEDALKCDMLNESFLASAPRARQRVYRFLPLFLAQVVEAYCVRNRYDVVVSWGERLTLAYAALLALTFARTPHVAMMYWISPPKKARPLRLLQSRIDRIIIWSATQRDFAVQQLGIPASKVVLIPYLVDQEFWRPSGEPSDRISAVGNEMRDYATLISAMRGLDAIPCEIIASRWALTPETLAQLDQGHAPANVGVHNASYTELREIYARSRFIVVPLYPSDTNHGLTVILEAMAMGKPVICSRVRGHTDVIQEGVTGFLVEQGNAEALRQAIDDLWSHPEEAERMGVAARRYIEQRHRFDDFVARVKAEVEDVVARRHATPAPPSLA